MVSSASIIIKKKSTGRKKIDIKKIENTNSLQVAFSKRRTGLFKKASELCVMTGAQVAIFVNSPAGRMYVFGSPDVDSLIERSHIQEINNNIVLSLPLLPQNNQSYQEVLNESDAGNTQSEMIESAGGIDPEKTWNEMITSTGSSNQSGSNDVIAVEELLSESDAGSTPNEMIMSSGGNINHGLEGVDEFFRGFDPKKAWNEIMSSTGSSNDVLGVEDLLSESDDAGQKIESAGSNESGISNDDEFFRGFDAEKAWNKMITSTGSNQSGSNDALEVQELLRNTPIVSSGGGLGWFDRVY